MARAFGEAMPKPQKVDRWLHAGSDVVVRLMGGVALGGGLAALFAGGFFVVVGAAVGGVLGVASGTPRAAIIIARQLTRSIRKK